MSYVSLFWTICPQQKNKGNVIFIKSKLIADERSKILASSCCRIPICPYVMKWFDSVLQPPEYIAALGLFSSAVVTTESDTMPGQIPEPSVTAGSLPSLGPLAGISATTLTDKLKYGDLQDFGPMLSPLHFLDSLGKRSLMIKAEVGIHVCRMTVASAVLVFKNSFVCLGV